MLALFHLSPVLLVTATLVVLRRPPVHAALAGTLLVVVLWLLSLIALMLFGRRHAQLTQILVLPLLLFDPAR